VSGAVRRFVVQEHTVRPGDVHYDLMIEDGEALVTVQLGAAPDELPRTGRASFDHRRRYLDYEGPISGDRGRVRIWDRGSAEDLLGDPRADCYTARFDGQRLRGALRMRRDREDVTLESLPLETT
jgi:hypothetical protein